MGERSQRKLMSSEETSAKDRMDVSRPASQREMSVNAPLKLEHTASRLTSSEPPQIPPKDLLIAHQLLKRTRALMELLHSAIAVFCPRFVLSSSLNVLRVLGGGVEAGGEHLGDVDKEGLVKLGWVEEGGARRVDIGE
jgi:hypothetical protein